MNEDSSHNTRQAQRSLPLLIIALFICSLHLVVPYIKFAGNHQEQIIDLDSVVYLWLQKGSYNTALYQLPAFLTFAGIYNAAGISMPEPENDSGIDQYPVNFSSVKLIERALPETTSLPSEAAIFFFRPIAINQADAAILATIHGIGPTLAARIVDERHKIGSFSSPEDLLAVRGLGPVKLARLQEAISF